MRVIFTYGQKDEEFFRRMLGTIGTALLCTGAAALLYAGYAVLDRHWYQSVETAAFEAPRAIPTLPAALPAMSPTVSSAPSLVAVPSATPPVQLVSGGVIGEIEVPRVGLKAIIAEGDSDRVLSRAVGHLPGTALPGEPGNIALAGHRDGLFRPLRDVRARDVISLRTHRGVFRYRVEWIAVVSPEFSDVLLPTEEHTLTLVTCYPFNYIGASPKRFVVRAHEVASTIVLNDRDRWSGKAGALP